MEKAIIGNGNGSEQFRKEVGMKNYDTEKFKKFLLDEAGK